MAETINNSDDNKDDNNKKKLKKKSLGQFYTTHQEYILQGMKIPDNIKNIIEPFTGNADLLTFIEKDKNKYKIECYDIDPKKDFIIKQDTIKNPPSYKDKYLITNPPYLARNKSKDTKQNKRHNQEHQQ